MFQFSEEQWRNFTKAERKILIMVHKYKIDDEEKIRSLMDWPLPAINKKTFSNYMSGLERKIAQIRETPAKISIVTVKEEA